jgi:hypothetical protein
VVSAALVHRGHSGTSEMPFIRQTLADTERVCKSMIDRNVTSRESIPVVYVTPDWSTKTLKVAQQMLDISSSTANVCDQHSALLHPDELHVSEEETLVPGGCL